MLSNLCLLQMVTVGARHAEHGAAPTGPIFEARCLAGESMIYIHGINHNSQHRGPYHHKGNADAFEAAVRHYCTSRMIDIIAEEYSVEVCQKDSVEESLCCAISRELGLVHLYCDPTSEERSAIGVPTPEELRQMVRVERGCKYIIGDDSRYHDQRVAEFHPQREEFWRARLAPFKDMNIFFACGSAHVESFARLLKNAGWETACV